MGTGAGAGVVEAGVRRAVALSLAAAMLTACGDEPASDVASTGTTATTAATTSGLAPVDVAVDCTGFDEREVVTSQEMVFAGTVVATEVRRNPESPFREAFVDDGYEDPGAPVPSEEELQDPDAGDPWPWTTFDVDRWWSQDFGTEIPIWTAGLNLEVGERWLIAGEMFTIQPGLPSPSTHSGIAAVCASSPYDEATAADWDEWFGGSVAAGDDGAPAGADPAVVATIEDGRARWNARHPVDYVYETRGVLVSVVDGEIVDAVGTGTGERPPLDAVLSVDEVFDAAVEASGATDHAAVVDPEWGFVTTYHGDDRSGDVGGGIKWFAPGEHVLAAGQGIAEALPDLRARWDAAGADDYRFTFTSLCFCFWEPVHVAVTGGVPEPAQVLGDHAATVEGLFALVEDELASDTVVAAFRTDLGVPVRVAIDRWRNAVDDELTVIVSSFEAR